MFQEVINVTCTVTKGAHYLLSDLHEYNVVKVRLIMQMFI